MKHVFAKIVHGVSGLMVTMIVLATPVVAQSNPTEEINAIVERIVTIATQVGSGIMILFIVKNAFELLQDGNNPGNRAKLAGNVFLLIVAALLLFRPDFILDAIRFIANA